MTYGNGPMILFFITLVLVLAGWLEKRLNR